MVKAKYENKQTKTVIQFEFLTLRFVFEISGENRGKEKMGRREIRLISYKRGGQYID